MPLVGVGGVANEPALSLANDTLSELLSQPFAWKFNRTQANILVTTQNRQDYQFAGASAWTQNYGAAIKLASANGITQSGFVVTVNTIQPHNFSVGETVYQAGAGVAAYNSVFTSTPSGSAWTGGWVITATPTTTSYTFTHAASGLGTSGAPGITNMSWLESATMVSMNDTGSAQYVYPLLAVRTLQAVSFTSLPDRVSILSDDGAGTLTIRFRYLPGSTPYGVTLIYQAAPPLLTSLSSTWTPFPDRLAFVYRQMFLALCYRFAESNRADIEYQKAQAAIARALGSDDRELSEEYVTPDSSIMAGYSGWGGWSL